MRFILILLIPSFILAQTKTLTPFEQAKENTFRQWRDQVKQPSSALEEFKFFNLEMGLVEAKQSKDLCKTFPNDCSIKAPSSNPDELKKQAKVRILLKDLRAAQKTRALTPDELKKWQEIRLGTEIEFQNFKCDKNEACDPDYFQDEYKKIFGKAYIPKPYINEVPGDYQQAINAHLLEVDKLAKEVKEAGLGSKIDNKLGWGHEFVASANPPTCEEQAIQELLQLFKDDSKNVLGKQFELTAIKTALLMKTTDSYKSKQMKSLEDFVNKQQKLLSKDSKIEALNHLYSQEPKAEDIKKIKGMVSKIKSGTLTYYNPEKRLLNEDISAFYLMMGPSQDYTKPNFGVEDAAVAWAFSKLSERIQDKKSVEYSKLSLSNQVNKLMDSRVAGGTDVPVKDLEKMKFNAEEEIAIAVKETLQAKLSPACLDELKVGDESCSGNLSMIQVEAFGRMMKEISEKYEVDQQPGLVAGYHAEIKQFIGELTTVHQPQSKHYIQQKKKQTDEIQKERQHSPDWKVAIDFMSSRQLSSTSQPLTFIKPVMKPAGSECWVDLRKGTWSMSEPQVCVLKPLPVK